MRIIFEFAVDEFTIAGNAFRIRVRATMAAETPWLIYCDFSVENINNNENAREVTNAPHSLAYPYVYTISRRRWKNIRIFVSNFFVIIDFLVTPTRLVRLIQCQIALHSAREQKKKKFLYNRTKSQDIRIVQITERISLLIHAIWYCTSWKWEEKKWNEMNRIARSFPRFIDNETKWYLFSRRYSDT